MRVQNIELKYNAKIGWRALCDGVRGNGDTPEQALEDLRYWMKEEDAQEIQTYIED